MKPLIRCSLLLCCFFAVLYSVTAQSNKKADVLLLYPKVSPGDSLKNNDLYQSLLTQCNGYDSYQGIEQHSEDARYTVLSLSEVSRYAYEVDADYFLVTSVSYVSPIRIVNAKLFSTIDMTVEWIDNYRVYADTNADTIASLIAFSIDEIITRANSLKAQPLNLLQQFREKSEMTTGFGFQFGSAYYRTSKFNPWTTGFGVVTSFESGKNVFDVSGRFFFGEIASHQIELAVHRFFPYFHFPLNIKAGVGFGGTSVNEIKFVVINGVQLRDVFTQYNSGFNVVAGIGVLINNNRFLRLRFHGEYFNSFYNLKSLGYPSGFRIGITGLIVP